MDKKVLLQDLADGLVKRRGLAKKDADQFVRTVFDIVSQYLEVDKLVKIKGLGTFKVIQVSSRESVNVNTGERIRIDGHAKVTFVPDAVLKDEVNKPFVHFETVVINDSTPLEDMERMDDVVEELEDGAEECNDSVVNEGISEQIDLSENQQEESETPEGVCENVSVDDISVGADMEQPEQVAGENSGRQEDNGLPVHELLESEVTDADTKESVEETSGEDIAPASPLQKAEDTQDEKATVPPQDASMSVEHLQTDYQRVEHQKVEDLNVASQRVEHQTIENQHIVQQERELSERKGMRITPWGMVGLLFLVLILMLGSYYAGYYGLLCPTCTYERVIGPKPETTVKGKVAYGNSVVPVVKRDTTVGAMDEVSKEASAGRAADVRRDTVRQVVVKEAVVGGSVKDVAERKEKVKVEKPASLSSGYAQVPGAKYMITGTRKTTVIQPGQTLRSIALEEYGSKGYASYIVVHNGIKDPNRVEAGKILKLPELEMRSR